MIIFELLYKFLCKLFWWFIERIREIFFAHHDEKWAPRCRDCEYIALYSTNSNCSNSTQTECKTVIGGKKPLRLFIDHLQRRWSIKGRYILLTHEIFNKSSVFVSYKTEQNILSMITKNRFKCKSQNNSEQTSVLGPGSGSSSVNVTPDAGCFGCVKKCTLCKDFLVECRQFTSSKTNQTFTIKSKITCDTKNVIYMITDKICEDVFYVGYTQDNMKTRWANHKSNIKAWKKTCKLASHFIKLANSRHKLDKSNQKVFTSQLRNHLEIRLIESVAPMVGIDMKEHIESREKFWQGTLKAAKLYGGLNKR